MVSASAQESGERDARNEDSNYFLSQSYELKGKPSRYIDELPQTRSDGKFRYEAFVSLGATYHEYKPPSQMDGRKNTTRTELGLMGSWELNENFDLRGFVYYEHYGSDFVLNNNKPILRFGFIDAHKIVANTNVGVRLGKVLTYDAFTNYQDNPTLRVVDHQPQSFHLNDQLWKSSTYGNGVQFYSVSSYDDFNATLEATYVKPILSNEDLSYALLRLPTYGFRLTRTQNKSLSATVRLPKWSVLAKLDRSWVTANFDGASDFNVSYIEDYLSLRKYWDAVSLTIELARSEYSRSIAAVSVPTAYGLNLLGQYRYEKWVYSIGYNQWRSGVASIGAPVKEFEQRVGFIGIKYRHDSNWTFKAEVHKKLGSDSNTFSKHDSTRHGNLVSVSTTYKF